MPISVAIDGPAGAGKSTIAKAVAERFGMRYLDTGAMYRAAALHMLRRGIAPSDRDRVIPELADLDMSVRFIDDVQHVFLADEDVTGLIRTPEVSEGASCVSAIPAVRRALVPMQRAIAEDVSIVMDGRDICTVVLPNAAVKLYVTADAAERARRRRKELLEKSGEEIAFETVLKDIIDRDERDSTREDSPLRRADDAVVLDTTHLSVDECVSVVEKLIKEARA